MKKKNTCLTKTSILLLTIAAVITFACNDKKNPVGKKPDKIARDTTQVLALYASARGSDVEYGFIKRVVADSFMFVDVDTVTQKRKWIKDTSYIIVYRVAVDTPVSRQYNVPLLDATGKPNFVNLTVPRVEKRFVRSGWNGVDTILIKDLLNQK